MSDKVKKISQKEAKKKKGGGFKFFCAKGNAGDKCRAINAENAKFNAELAKNK
jgi:hypothetical protein